MKTVVITGDRRWSDPEPIKDALRGADMLIVGDCPPHAATRSSADALALLVARRWDIIPLVFAASPERASLLRQRGICVELVSDWNRDGKDAGPLRNQAIADAARAARSRSEVRCYAFPFAGSVGTHDCIRRLRAAGFAVAIHSASTRQRRADDYELER